MQRWYSIDEELKAAKAAKAAINALAARKSEGLTTLKHAYRVAVLNLSGGEGLLNEARGRVGIAISNGTLTCLGPLCVCYFLQMPLT